MITVQRGEGNFEIGRRKTAKSKIMKFEIRKENHPGAHLFMPIPPVMQGGELYR
jgi:hypothetical protein